MIHTVEHDGQPVGHDWSAGCALEYLGLESKPPIEVTMTSPGRYLARRAGVDVGRFYWYRNHQVVTTMSGQVIGQLTRRGRSAMSGWDATTRTGAVAAQDVAHEVALAALIDGAGEETP